MAAPPSFERESVEVDGVELSYLHAGRHGPRALLLHGTFWSRVWQPVLPQLGVAGEVFALDLPGFGESAGRLERDGATVPELARWALRFLDALGLDGPIAVAGHDIGGAIAQHLAAHEPDHVARLALLNSVLYDSWPVPAVERFRDPEVVANTSVDDLLEARRTSLGKAIDRELSDAEIDEYLRPWRSEDRAHSWMAMAAAADARFTLDLVERLRERALPTLVVWGVDDEFQPIAHARRFVEDMPDAELVEIEGARHIPTEDAPDRVAHALAGFLAGA